MRNFSILEKTELTCHTIFFPHCDLEVLVRSHDHTYFALTSVITLEADYLQVIIITVPYEEEGKSLYCYAD